MYLLKASWLSSDMARIAWAPRIVEASLITLISFDLLAISRIEIAASYLIPAYVAITSSSGFILSQIRQSISLSIGKTSSHVFSPDSDATNPGLMKLSFSSIIRFCIEMYTYSQTLSWILSFAR